MRLLTCIMCIMAFIIAGFIIYCAYVGEVMGVAVLASALALYASRGYLMRGGEDHD